MTLLTKAVSRRTTLFLDNRLQARSRDQITVTLYPDNTIGFRQHKCRKEVRLDLVVAYRLALIEEVKEAKKIKDQEDRLAGRKRRKRNPKRSSLY